MPSLGSDQWELWAISPLDGRYRKHLAGLGDLIGEGALISYRTKVEAAWLLHLADVPEIKSLITLPPAARQTLLMLTEGAGRDWQVQIKEIEKTTNHDVKAVEYYLQHRLKSVGVEAQTLAFIHFACTSEDINNLAYALMLKDLRALRLLPLLAQVTVDLASKAGEYADVAMLSRTHGQTATPTTLGKEMAVFGRRLQRLHAKLEGQVLEGKMNGAVGNYNAHMVAFPNVDWPAVAQHFVVEKLGLSFNPLTTQIENHDSVVEYVATLHHINAILIGLSRDIWGYVSLGYFRQRLKAGEIGSSTMPHKVNPIDFENAEGNLGIANAIAGHFSDKLPISRWQRDLSDSTVLRSLATLVGHTELAWRSLLRGLGKLSIDEVRIASDLDAAWEVLAEPVQTVLRRYGVVDAYEQLKEATRGKAVTRAALHQLIDQSTALPAAAKDALRALTPGSYTGAAASLARQFAATVLPGARPN